MLDRQRDYLLFARRGVQARKPEGELGFFAKLSLRSEIESAFSKLGYTGFMRDGLAELWPVEAMIDAMKRQKP